MSRETVVDPSAAMAWFLQDEETAHAKRLYRLIVEGSIRLVVPELWNYETLNVLRSATVRGRLSQAAARRTQRVLERLPREVVPSESQGRGAILARALDLGISAYDASYFALAESRSVELVASDHHLLALRPRFSWIMTIEEFLQNVWDRQPPEERPPSSTPEPPNGEGRADPGSRPGSG